MHFLQVFKITFGILNLNYENKHIVCWIKFICCMKSSKFSNENNIPYLRVTQSCTNGREGWTFVIKNVYTLWLAQLGGSPRWHLMSSLLLPLTRNDCYSDYRYSYQQHQCFTYERFGQISGSRTLNRWLELYLGHWTFLVTLVCIPISVFFFVFIRPTCLTSNRRDFDGFQYACNTQFTIVLQLRRL